MQFKCSSSTAYWLEGLLYLTHGQSSNLRLCTALRGAEVINTKVGKVLLRDSKKI